MNITNIVYLIKIQVRFPLCSLTQMYIDITDIDLNWPYCHDVNYPILVPIRTDQQIPADFVDISLYF